MKGESIPPEHHLAMHCQPSHMIEVNPDGERNGVSYRALRVDSDGMSSNWLEFDGITPGEQFGAVCKLLRTVRTVRPSHRLGVMGVKSVLAAGKLSQLDLRVVHDPIVGPPPPENPGHALTQGATPDNEILLQTIAASIELHEFV